MNMGGLRVFVGTWRFIQRQSGIFNMEAVLDAIHYPIIIPVEGGPVLPLGHVQVSANIFPGAPKVWGVC